MVGRQVVLRSPCRHGTRGNIANICLTDFLCGSEYGETNEESSQYKSDVLEAMLWSDRYITLDNDHACANYKSIAHLHSQGTDELVVEALNNMLQLVESLENLAGLVPPPRSDNLPGTRGGSPLHRATGRMTFDVHGHIRIKRVRGIVHVGRSMSVSTNCVWHHARMDCVVPNRTCACNTCTDSDTFPAHPTGEHMVAIFGTSSSHSISMAG